MKGNKGFAISSVVYAMLVLFLGLILLILGNLASRKAAFDKEKNEILAKFDSDKAILCRAKSTPTNGYFAYGYYNYGDEYSCDLGDGELKTFYVLENHDITVSLIMNENLKKDGEVITTSWISNDDYKNNGGKDLSDEIACKYSNYCAGNELGPITANRVLKENTTSWTKINSAQISLPTYAQISAAAGNSASNLPTWLYENNSIAYWTSTSSPSDTLNVIAITNNGISTYINVGQDSCVRPVITISKNQITNLELEILCTAKSTVTNGNLATGEYNYGDEYSCVLGDEDEKTFYVLENHDTTVSLIMNMNIDSEGKGTTSGNAVAWSEDEPIENGPVTALAYLKSSTTSWTKLEASQISLPTKEQLYTAAGDKTSNLPLWLHENLNTDTAPFRYWTSTAIGNNYAYDVELLGSSYILGPGPVNSTTTTGVRPVITIPKAALNR